MVTELLGSKDLWVIGSGSQQNHQWDANAATCSCRKILVGQPHFPGSEEKLPRVSHSL